MGAAISWAWTSTWCGGSSDLSCCYHNDRRTDEMAAIVRDVAAVIVREAGRQRAALVGTAATAVY